ncbi:MAG: hypothetical protein ACRDOL_03325 [Streptosporangiaceae bacterium]
MTMGAILAAAAAYWLASRARRRPALDAEPDGRELTPADTPSLT